MYGSDSEWNNINNKNGNDGGVQAACGYNSSDQAESG